ncbi:unnamed protein product [Paramecium pentaurelia]|uniref:Protein kinase domain-containing protein n=1 Tax=Paramecium pentaurelia TaxID=43138 RepID=A0A8S1SUP5_9CILI|nr:unnamed protein product [Paramecium pentaurelia]
MRQKSDSCFSLYSNRCTSLWINGLPNLQENSERIIFHNVNIKNSQKKPIKFQNAFIQEKYLIADQRFINLENLQLRRQVIKNAERQISNIQYLNISNNLDSIEIFGPELQINQIYNYLKLYTIQQQFEDSYQIIKILGKGSFAKVYKVRKIHVNYQSLDKQEYTFASKVFNKIKLRQNQEESEMSLWKEIEIMRLMKNKHIIKLFEVFEDDKKVYLLLDLLEGGDLLSHIFKNNNIYDETLVLKLIHNVLNGLSYIHNQKVIHRDIKPENLILKYKNNIEEIILADFGLADFYSLKGEYLFQRCGSIGYIAPEILNNQKYDYKVDIYSLGAVFFLLLTGQQAFDGQSSHEILQKNQKGKIDFKLLDQANISEDAKDLCMKMLKQNPTERISSDEALNHPWFQTYKKNVKIGSLKIIKKPTIVRGHKGIIRCYTPLWINKSLKSITDSSDNQEYLSFNVRDKTIQEFLDEEHLKQKQVSREYDLEDDTIEEDQIPSFNVLQHFPLVKQKSFP